jgi:hypothetical protein
MRLCEAARAVTVRRTLLALGAAAGFLLPCQAGQPERVVVNNTLLSQRDPAVEIRLPGSVRYVGSDRFVLTDPRLGSFDDCELYAFVEANAHGDIRKLYWVQFEAYLPNQPQLRHTYDSPRHVTIAGLDFYLDTWVSAAATAPTPGSDEAHLQSLLASQRLRRDDSMSVRLVHLTDATRRKELMVIYAESLAPTGFSAAELKEHGADHAKWAAIERGLIRRAEHSIAIRVVGAYSTLAPR